MSYTSGDQISGRVDEKRDCREREVTSDAKAGPFDNFTKEMGRRDVLKQASVWNGILLLLLFWRCDLSKPSKCGVGRQIHSGSYRKDTETNHKLRMPMPTIGQQCKQTQILHL